VAIRERQPEEWLPQDFLYLFDSLSRQANMFEALVEEVIWTGPDVSIVSAELPGEIQPVGDV
jgi:hypothetical protein